MFQQKITAPKALPSDLIYNPVQKFSFKPPNQQQAGRAINGRNQFLESKGLNETLNTTLLNITFNVPSTSRQADLNETSVEPKTTTIGAPLLSLGASLKERFLVLTGNVERVIKWRTFFQNHFCYFVAIGQVIAVHEGRIRMQKILILRDKNKGPILQVSYYTTATYMNIEDFHLGQMLKCAGTMVGPNMLSAHSIRAAKPEELETLQRHCCICDRSIAHFINS